MNKNKISPNILKKVSALGIDTKQEVILTCNDFNKTKQLLQIGKFNYLPYRFASCFKINADFDDVCMFSNLNEIDYIFENNLVCSFGAEKDLLNTSNLTLNKYLGQGQTICFIDTGIYPSVDFLLPKNRIIKFIDLINQSSTPYDDNGHGTFVAGIACGNGVYSNKLKGYAPQANIISIKALDKTGVSNSNVILDAMQWVYENYKAYHISVVCMSLGADIIADNDPLTKGAEALWRKGIVVVAAAGNSGPEKSTIKSPGNNPNIITVGGLDCNSITVADFSSRGPTIYGHKPDLLAPAVDIISCNNNTPPYTKMSGTSVATPIVAGICADILSRYPNAKNYEIKQFLKANCTKITGEIDTEGAGYLNFKNLK